MALTIDPATKVISVPQSDLAFVSGTKWTFDTNVQRKAIMALLASEAYIWMDDAFVHNTEVTVAGVTYARTLEMVNSYSLTLENTGSAYSADFQGSNNNFFDIENGILNPTPLVTVQSNNSAGLQTVATGGLTAGQTTQLTELYIRMGLDVTDAITDTTAGIDSASGDINIDRTGDGVTTSTLTRQP